MEVISCPVDWDPIVFESLPRELQEELLRSRPQQVDCQRNVEKNKRGITEVESASPNILHKRRIGGLGGLNDHDRPLFVDVQFPPTSDSIDGRYVQRRREVFGDTNQGPSCRADKDKKLQCRCQPPAIASIKRVFKDGPNQGRYFACCPSRKCGFFAWADFVQHDAKVESIQWKRFEAHEGWLLYGKGGCVPDDVLQGGVGDCWFLSAVAVLAERPDLTRALIRDDHLSEEGRVNFCLFIDGHWRDISVDNHLPCRPPSAQKLMTVSSFGGVQEGIFAYSKPNQRRLWVPLLEKAYAKAHGSYHAISGGHIHEALLDLTGAPCEVINFASSGFDSEETWVRLLSFNASRFPMGCATDSSGEGIVGGHAYSILDVRELHGVSVGGQLSMKGFLDGATQSSGMSMSSASQESKYSTSGATSGNSGSNSYDDDDDEVVILNGSNHTQTQIQSATCSSSSGTSQSIERMHGVSELFTENGALRMIRIRNPWGKVEWKGSFSDQSELWTSHLKGLLDRGKKNDGTFWITYHDFLRRFSSIDICKVHVGGGWTGQSYEDETRGKQSGIMSFDLSSKSYFFVTAVEHTWVYFTIIQKTKRGKTVTARDHSYWYSPISLAVLQLQRNERAVGTVEWTVGDVVGFVLCGARRDSPAIELQLPPGNYGVVPIVLPSWTTIGNATMTSASSGRQTAGYQNKAQQGCCTQTEGFVLRVYSSCPLLVETQPSRPPTSSIHSQCKPSTSTSTSYASARVCASATAAAVYASSSSAPSSSSSTYSKSAATLPHPTSITSSNLNGDTSVRFDVSSILRSLSAFRWDSAALEKLSGNQYQMPLQAIAILKAADPRLPKSVTGLTKRYLGFWRQSQSQSYPPLQCHSQSQSNPYQHGSGSCGRTLSDSRVIDITQDSDDDNDWGFKQEMKGHYDSGGSGSRSRIVDSNSGITLQSLRGHDDTIILLAKNDSQVPLHCSLLLGTWNYYTSTPFGEHMDLMLSNLSGDDLKSAGSQYVLRFAMPPQSYRILAVLVAAPLGQTFITDAGQSASVGGQMLAVIECNVSGLTHNTVGATHSTSSSGNISSNNNCRPGYDSRQILSDQDLLNGYRAHFAAVKLGST